MEIMRRITADEKGDRGLFGLSSRLATIRSSSPRDLDLMSLDHAIKSFGSALISVRRHGVSTESGSDRVSLISKIRIANNVYPVATALGTDLITKIRVVLAVLTKAELSNSLV